MLFSKVLLVMTVTVPSRNTAPPMPLSAAKVAEFAANLDDVMLTRVTLVADVPATCNAPPLPALNNNKEPEAAMHHVDQVVVTVALCSTVKVQVVIAYVWQVHEQEDNMISFFYGMLLASCYVLKASW